MNPTAKAGGFRADFSVSEGRMAKQIILRLTQDDIHLERWLDDYARTGDRTNVLRLAAYLLMGWYPDDMPDELRALWAQLPVAGLLAPQEPEVIVREVPVEVVREVAAPLDVQALAEAFREGAREMGRELAFIFLEHARPPDTPPKTAGGWAQTSQVQ